VGIKIDGGVDAGKIREDAPADVLKLLRSRESSWRDARQGGQQYQLAFDQPIHLHTIILDG
jgi:hypothetical protein